MSKYNHNLQICELKFKLRLSNNTKKLQQQPTHKDQYKRNVDKEPIIGVFIIRSSSM